MKIKMDSGKMEKYLLFLILCFTATVIYANEQVVTIDGYQIYKSATVDDNIYTQKTVTYTVKDAGGSFFWTVTKPSSAMGEEDGLFLSLNYPSVGGFNGSLKSQRPMHRAVLKKIFKDWKPEYFKSMSLPSLSRIDPGFGLNIPVCLASAQSEEYGDYRKNYPNHKSGKHINHIFVDIAKTTNIFQLFREIIEVYHMAIILTSVEKVFSNQVDRMAFKDALLKKGLSGRQRVLYDAGVFYFEIKGIKY